MKLIFNPFVWLQSPKTQQPSFLTLSFCFLLLSSIHSSLTTQPILKQCLLCFRHWRCRDKLIMVSALKNLLLIWMILVKREVENNSRIAYIHFCWVFCGDRQGHVNHAFEIKLSCTGMGFHEVIKVVQKYSSEYSEYPGDRVCLSLQIRIWSF